MGVNPAEEKPVIILDLDQTLISAEELDNGVYKYQDKYADKMKKFKSVKMEEDFLVFERPYLQKFLTYIFDNFRVSIFIKCSVSMPSTTRPFIIFNKLNIRTKSC